VSRQPALARAVRVLLVDDSATSRAHLAAILEDAPGIQIVGQAVDGEEGLRQVMKLQPDVIVLDLQMPRMDGFTFLRLLMPRRPTPVVVVSSLTRRSDVFRALELGALDFVAKPSGTAASLEAFREEVLQKCATVRALRLENLAARRPMPVVSAPPEVAPRVVAVGASTGGPQALHQLLAALPGEAPLAVLVAQHMPERFTGTFADRLSRTTSFSAKEATEGDRVAAGRILVAPGGRHLELVRDDEGALRTHIAAAEVRRRRYTPSIDRLFTSVAEACGPDACGLVLTGMGNDGREGVQAIKRAGGLTLAESAETAVVYGMPQAAIDTGAVDEVLALGAIAERLLRFARES
jgi:two-component system, chemotaxis family, protein-glutamate methylesterase/glutaminase